jgi:hypothetical protein
MKSGAKARYLLLVNVAAEAATHNPSHSIGGNVLSIELDDAAGIARVGLLGVSGGSDCASEGERDALLAELEKHFGPQRFLNTSAAFDGVKNYIAQWAVRRG